MRTSGLALIAVAVVVLVGNYVAVDFWPEQWGGPNVLGGGFINLAAAAVPAVGVVVFVRARARR